MILTKEQVKWAYEKWCMGYTLEQIADALYCDYQAVRRALIKNGYKGRRRPKLVWEGTE